MCHPECYLWVFCPTLCESHVANTFSQLTRWKEIRIVLHLWFYKRCGVWTNSRSYSHCILHFLLRFRLHSSDAAIGETLTEIWYRNLIFMHVFYSRALIHFKYFFPQKLLESFQPLQILRTIVGEKMFARFFMSIYNEDKSKQNCSKITVAYLSLFTLPFLVEILISILWYRKNANIYGIRTCLCALVAIAIICSSNLTEDFCLVKNPIEKSVFECAQP